jgi:hypothetical protein
MAVGMLICGGLTALLCFGLFFIYLIWMALLARFLPKKRKDSEKTAKERTFEGEVIDAEFEEK